MCMRYSTTPLALVTSVSEYDQLLVHVSVPYSGDRTDQHLHVHVRYCNSLSAIGKISLGYEYVIEINPHHNIINVALQ